jgi:hypothetical protein
MSDQPDFELGRDAELILTLLVERLRDAQPMVTLVELQKLCGQPIRQLYGALYTARKLVLRDHRKWYRNSRGVGYHVVDDDDLHEVGEDYRSRARNCSRRSLKVLKVGDPAKVTREGHLKHVAEQSIAELIASATAPRRIDSRIETMRGDNRPLDPKATMEEFRRAMLKG